MSLELSRVLLDRFFSGAGVAEARPPMDWKETPSAHVFAMDVPGLPRERVAVEVVDGRILRVRGGKNEEEDANDDDAEEEEEGGDAVRWHCRERVVTGATGRRAFVTQFRLPEDADADAEGASARMEDGLLTVTVPKSNKGGGKKRRHGRAAGDKPVCCSCRLWP